jgi:serine/threonine-protein kinase
VQQPVQPSAPVRSPTVALRRLRRRRWLIAILVVLLLGLAAAAGGWWIGGRWAATPAAVGLAQADAENLIRNAGLVPRVITEHHNDVPSGLVAVTNPAAGTEQLRGSEVDLLVSTGRPQVPSIPAGIDTRAAMAALTAADLTAVVAAKPTFDDTVPAGAVLRTDPAAGTAMTVGAQVTLVLSGGPGVHAVPDVRGQPTKDAVRSLEKAGFTVTVGDPAFDPDIDAGDILRTDPGPGATVDPNDAKIFLVPSNAVQVPDLTDSTVTQAEKKLDKLGLKLSVTALFGGGDASIWTQSPGAGGRVEPGGTVSASAFP